MDNTNIVIRGAREHNLRDVDLELPRNRLVVFTGVSGSGKSSLAFDTLYAEGQRRYVESLSSYARQFLGQMQKPDVDYLAGLSPAISIQQKAAGRNPRSTVGTITEIYDYLRVLYARVGQGHCPQCERPIQAQTREQIIARILALPAGTRFLMLAPVIRGQKGEYKDLFQDMLRRGFIRARVDGLVVRLSDDLQLDRRMKHFIEIVVDRLTVDASEKPASDEASDRLYSLRSRVAEAVEQSLRLAEGNLIVAVEKSKSGDKTDYEDLLLSAHYACTHCNRSYEPPSPQLFSFNSPQGMCLDCDGLGTRFAFDPALLIPDPEKSFYLGAIPLVGPLKGMGRWRKHIFNGVAETLGIDLKQPWSKLPRQQQDWLLHGTGDRHITYEWKMRGGGVWKHGGNWEGIVPQLMSSFKKTAAGPRRLQLEKYMRSMQCPTCNGQRLNPQARHVRVAGKTLIEVCAMTVGDLAAWLDGNARPLDRDARGGKLSDSEAGESKGGRKPARSRGLTTPARLARVTSPGGDGGIEARLDPVQRMIAAEVLKEIRGRLGFLLNVGLHYLTLDRAAPSLSGGEAQRIRLAGQIGCGLVGVLYILDEPSIGLHPRDNERLLESLERLRDMGNTVLVVEHDEETMRAADFLVDFGPGPGVRGGQVVSAGSFDEVLADPKSLTGQYLSGTKSIPIPAQRRPAGKHQITIHGATHHNLKGIDVPFPLGLFVCVTGVSGSGKSSLVNDILLEALQISDLRFQLDESIEEENGDSASGKRQATSGNRFERITGTENIDKVIAIDQSPIGRTPRSNPATYIKVFDEIRNLFALLPEAKVRGYKPGRFSFNRPGGRCEACEGNGSNRLEMDFLADVWVTCPVCEGRRFNRETLQVRFKGKNIHEVLEMDVQEALEHFSNVSRIREMLQTLHDVGMDYVKLGQASPTLSGGEAQRIKLARELCKRSTGRTLYILDEPTTGLHFDDIQKLLTVLHGFVTSGNTVVVIEHNLDVIKTADWLIDLGPEGGAGGGEIVCAGTPEEVAACAESFTGEALVKVLDAKKQTRKPHAQSAASRGRKSPEDGKRRNSNTTVSASIDQLTVVGAQQHNLKNITVTLPREKMSVCCGPSGSGKSSLALDTIYAEGQRRYIESLSAYARQFLGQMQKPKVEHITGLSPAISIEQKTASKSPRSTVGTVTEIYDYLRVLFARMGKPFCPVCHIPVGTQTSDEIIERIQGYPEGTKLYLMAPVERRGQEKYSALFDEIRRSGFVRLRVDGKSHTVEDPPQIDHRRKHLVEVVIDRLVVRGGQRARVADAVEAGLDLGRGVVHVALVDDARDEADWKVERFSQHFACDQCGRSFEPLNPHHFSFNSPLGWCGTCEGLGVQLGANVALLIRDAKRSLREGALSAWPELSPDSPFTRFAEAIARHAGFGLDTPFEQLEPAQQRVVLYGTGEAWIDAPDLGAETGAVSRKVKQAPAKKRSAKTASASLRFQYKGLFPAIDEAARVSFVYRQRLEHLVSEVACSTCGGSRLRPDAAAFRLPSPAPKTGAVEFGPTIGELCARPLGETLAFFNDYKLDRGHQKVAGELFRELKNRLKFLVDVGLDYLTLDRAAPTL
ncbi:MAG: excinuclease ABC subunit UvrA, partial [Gemmataceae bacterium]